MSAVQERYWLGGDAEEKAITEATSNPASGGTRLAARGSEKDCDRWKRAMGTLLRRLMKQPGLNILRDWFDTESASKVSTSGLG